MCSCAHLPGGDGGAEVESRCRCRPGGEGSAEQGDAFGQPGQAPAVLGASAGCRAARPAGRAHDWGGVGGDADLAFADRQLQIGDRFCRCVTAGVGKRLLDDPPEGQAHRQRQPRLRCRQLSLRRQCCCRLHAGGGEGGDDLRQCGQVSGGKCGGGKCSGCRRCRFCGVAGVAQQGDEGADIAQRLPGRRGDLFQRGDRRLGVGACRDLTGMRLCADERQPVGEDVVEFAGDALAFGSCCSLLGIAGALLSCRCCRAQAASGEEHRGEDRPVGDDPPEVIVESGTRQRHVHGR